MITRDEKIKIILGAVARYGSWEAASSKVLAAMSNDHSGAKYDKKAQETFAEIKKLLEEFLPLN